MMFWCDYHISTFHNGATYVQYGYMFVPNPISVLDEVDSERHLHNEKFLTVESSPKKGKMTSASIEKVW